MTPFRRRRRRAALILAILGAVWSCAWWWGNDLLRGWESSRESVAHGTPEAGWLEHGKRLPTRGANFRTYSRLASLFGRTAVHSTVRDILVESWGVMGVRHPGTTFIYGETGFPGGGRFLPHRTHQIGGAVDLFVPVVDETGEASELPLDRWTEATYSIEFDSTGHWKEFTIDFPVLADELLTLDSIARAHGAPMTRVVLAPELMDELAATELGRRAVAELPWLTAETTTRHDDHFHIDFGVPTVQP